MKNIYDILADINSGTKKKIILDTDTYNEIDDQFALAYAMLLSGQENSNIELLSVNAAPYLNTRSTSPLDGMEKSYDEIKRIVNFIDPSSTLPVYKGSTKFMESKDKPEMSDAAKNIIDTSAAFDSDNRLYVVAIGAPTNVSAALTIDPTLKDRIAVVWLGGTALHWPSAREFNMMQDINSSQILLDCGVPLADIPCAGVCTHLATTIPELEYHLRGKNKPCDYLVDIVSSYPGHEYPTWSKVIWDVSAIACLAVPNSMSQVVIPTPRLTCDCYYAQDQSRHPYIYITHMNRDLIFGELFKTLASADIE